MGATHFLMKTLPRVASDKELDMPTNIAVAVPAANAVGVGDNSLAVVKNPDLIAVICFSTIGLLLTIGFELFFPLSSELTALF
jgi:hypothetical protein